MLLITQPRCGVSHNEILALQIAARERGWDVLPAPNGWRLTEETIESKAVGVPYGSQIFCEVIAQQMNWKLLANQFDWLSKLRPEYLGRKVQFMTLGEAKKLQEKKFIKPADDKVFPAAVYEPGQLITFDIVSDDTPTLVSDVVQFDLEYRCFVDGYKVLTWSNYVCHEHVADPKYWYMVDYDEQSILFKDYLLPFKFVNKLLLDNHPKTVPSVIDVGRISGKGLFIIETNQAWASGIYGCDPNKVLEVLEESCVPM